MTSNEPDESDEYFSGAFYEPEFERMKKSPFVTIQDYAAMGSMPDYDYYVSFRVETTANGGKADR